MTPREAMAAAQPGYRPLPAHRDPLDADNAGAAVVTSFSDFQVGAVRRCSLEFGQSGSVEITGRSTSETLSLKPVGLLR